MPDAVFVVVDPVICKLTKQLRHQCLPGLHECDDGACNPGFQCMSFVVSYHHHRDAGMPRDALALASAQLLPNDPVLVDCQLQYGRHLQVKGLLEAAAANLLMAGSTADAVTALSMRGTFDAFLGAAEIAARAELYEVSIPGSVSYCHCHHYKLQL